MDSNMDCYSLLDHEIRDYYEPLTLLKTRHIDTNGGCQSRHHVTRLSGIPTLLDMAVRPSYLMIVMVLWNVNEGIIMNRKKKVMRRPGLIELIGEMFVMNVDPSSKMIVYKVANSSSSEAEVGKGLKKRTSSSFEATGKMAKQAKEHFVASVEVHRKTSMKALRSDTAAMYLTEGIDRHHQ